MSVNQNDLQRVIAEVLAAEPVAGGGIDPWHAAEEVIDAFRYIGWTVVPNPGDRRPATPDEFLRMLGDVSADGGRRRPSEASAARLRRTRSASRGPTKEAGQ